MNATEKDRLRDTLRQLQAMRPAREVAEERLGQAIERAEHILRSAEFACYASVDLEVGWHRRRGRLCWGLRGGSWRFLYVGPGRKKGRLSALAEPLVDADVVVKVAAVGKIEDLLGAMLEAE